MPKYKVFLLLPAMAIISLLAAAQNAGRISFNSNWKFLPDSVHDHSSPAANTTGWRTLNLPHDWSIEGTFDKHHPATPEGGALPGGIGWYTKTFYVPATQKDKLVFVEFDGVYRYAQVFINGHSLGIRPYGYSSFRYNLTPYLNYGTAANVITVKVDNSKQPNSRWYSGSGIYRNVWLTTVAKTYVDYSGTFITTPKVSPAAATAAIETRLINAGTATKDLVLKTTIYDAGGRQVATVATPVAALPFRQQNDSATIVKQALAIKMPRRWSLEDPYRYKAVTQVIDKGRVTDTYNTLFGIRSFNFDVTKGFFLNGKPVKILGVCNHHDLGALGAAINYRGLERQLQLLKAMGCNGIRTTHNPPAPELLDLCDKMGFIVMDEAFDMWAKDKTTYDYHLDWSEWHRKDLQDFVQRDRNHPSVFIWSVGNEIPEQWGDTAKADTAGRTIARELVSIVKALDTTREVVTANNQTASWNNIILSGAFGMVGYNYHHQEWAGVHDRWPGKKFIVTESTSALQTRGYYDPVPFDTIRRWPKRWDIPFTNPNGTFTVSAYDHVSAPWGSTHEESIKELLKSPHVAGMYIWTGFDYLGEPTPYSWPARSSYFGILDLAGFPKDVYYLYQSIFTSTPVLHLYPHWNWKHGDTIDVVAYYNNADETELFLNGTSLGIQKKMGDDLHVKWRVPFVPGTLKAVSRKNGQVVLTKTVNTAGNAAAIRLSADRSTIKANGNDLSYVTVTVIDKDGNTVPDAGDLVEFSISGPGTIAGVDNGDPTSHEPFKASQHKALNGLALAIVQAGGRPGKITLTAKSKDLTAATITINTQ